MADVFLTDGKKVSIPDEVITLIAGPYEHDVGPHTYVYGAGPGVIITNEAPQGVVSRLVLKTPLAQFVRPDGSPVWLKASAVKAVLVPYPHEFDSTATVRRLTNVGCVLVIDKLRQAIVQDEATAVKTIVDLGGNPIAA